MDDTQRLFSMDKNEWSWQGDLSESLRAFSEKLRAWNRDTLGNIFIRKRRVSQRPEGVQQALVRNTTVGLLELEKELRIERNDILMQEEMLW